jgi:hypothetical protein
MPVAGYGPVHLFQSCRREAVTSLGWAVASRPQSPGSCTSSTRAAGSIPTAQTLSSSSPSGSSAQASPTAGRSPMFPRLVHRRLDSTRDIAAARQRPVVITAHPALMPQVSRLPPPASGWRACHRPALGPHRPGSAFARRDLVQHCISSWCGASSWRPGVCGGRWNRLRYPKPAPALGSATAMPGAGEPLLNDRCHRGAGELRRPRGRRCHRRQRRSRHQLAQRRGARR